MPNRTRRSRNGKIERSFRTVKDNFINCNDWNSFSSLEDLNDKYYQYVNCIYNNSIHSSIQDTPRNRYLKDNSLIRHALSDEILNEYFLYSYERKVASDSTIQLWSKSFEVPSRYVKQKITVKCEPNNFDVAYIYENGKKLETIYPLKRVDNSNIKRKSLSYSNLGGLEQ